MSVTGGAAPASSSVHHLNSTVTPDYLRKLMPEHDKNQHLAFVHFYNKFKKLAVEAAKTGASHLEYHIPMFDMGLAKYDPERLFKDLIKKLGTEHFDIVDQDSDGLKFDAAWMKQQDTHGGSGAAETSDANTLQSTALQQRQSVPTDLGYNYRFLQDMTDMYFQQMPPAPQAMPWGPPNPWAVDPSLYGAQQLPPEYFYPHMMDPGSTPVAQQQPGQGGSGAAQQSPATKSPVTQVSE